MIAKAAHNPQCPGTSQASKTRLPGTTRHHSSSSAACQAGNLLLIPTGLWWGGSGQEGRALPQMSLQQESWQDLGHTTQCRGQARHIVSSNPDMVTSHVTHPTPSRPCHASASSPPTPRSSSPGWGEREPHVSDRLALVGDPHDCRVQNKFHWDIWTENSHLWG